jgi:signal transduction histidine kinase
MPSAPAVDAKIDFGRGSRRRAGRTLVEAMTSTPRWHHALLPGALREQPDGRRSARDWLVDLLMLVIAVGVGLFVLLDVWSEHGTALALVDIALGVASLVALWWRRSHPGVVGALATAASVVSGLAAGPAVIAGFNVALRGSRRAILAVVALTAVSTLVFPLIYYTGESYLLNLVVGVLLTAVVIGWGLLARVSREHVLTLHERAAQLEAEQRLRIEQARDAERRRIAGEMHDVLAHRISLLSLHAGALEFRPDASPQEISEAAGVIRAAARAALEELRQVIGVLRDGAPDEGPEPPQPTLADIPALVEESRVAGARVRCQIDVAGAEQASAALGRTAYRVVQEGLTNARKHAPAAPVDVTVTGGERLVVEVISRRPVGVAVAAEALPGAGSGLIGLNERVELAGGELEHGLAPAGDFVLRATLPWAP